MPIESVPLELENCLLASMQWNSESYNILGNSYTAICIKGANKGARTPTMAP